MSYKGTPWYDMAIDAGMRGEEAEQMALLLESQAEYEAARDAEQRQAEEAEWEQLMAEEQEQAVAQQEQKESD